MLATTPDASCKLPLRQPSAQLSCAALLCSLRNPHAPLAFFTCQQDSSKSQRGHHDFVIFAPPSGRWPYLTHDPKRKSNSIRTAFDRTGQYRLRLRQHKRIVFGFRELFAEDALSRLYGAARGNLDLSRRRKKCRGSIHQWRPHASREILPGALYKTVSSIFLIPRSARQTPVTREIV